MTTNEFSVGDTITWTAHPEWDEPEGHGTIELVGAEDYFVRMAGSGKAIPVHKDRARKFPSGSSLEGRS